MMLYHFIVLRSYTRKQNKVSQIKIKNKNKMKKEHQYISFKNVYKVHTVEQITVRFNI